MKTTTEVYGVYDDNFNLMFPDAISIKASVQEGAKLMEHPLEDGSSVTDHRIILPVEIELEVFLPAGTYKDSYNNIRQAFKGAQLFVVHLATGIYSRMAMQAMPHEESPERAESISIALQLKEAQIITTQYQALPPRKVRDKKDTSTVSRGEQQPQQQKTTAASAADALEDAVTPIFGVK